MVDVHGWIVLSDSTYESDWDAVDPKIEELAAWVELHLTWATKAAFDNVGGVRVLTLHAVANHATAEFDSLLSLVRRIAKELPGSHGLLHWRDDESPLGNSYKVYVVRRGLLVEEADPFFSPCNPKIED
ncbi:Imm7 family immunity protein [Luteipulveratus flavus]|uniref:Imm7 family immunity protein n=1 Tax=Luteipulveratus flavus TaxID=3031728 RepID=A0ABT6C8C2_9MICO|nr:Imm7 family immunity protein [Luteipulveratus sp. YIM 133296]MDF8265188.1 Imm7 family immunity protein [Luteipulveratus sp. YIM 133296]